MREYGVGMLDHVLSGDTSSLTGEFCAIARLYIDAFDALHDLWEAGNLSVVHGDGHATNLFLDHRRAGFFDWGCFSLAPPMRDVSYFLCMALGIEHRRALERPLIERYLARRAELGSPGPSIEDAWEQHRLHAGYTVVAAAPAALYQGGVTTADPAYSRAFVERAGAAVADLDSVAALRATIGR
jgi:aminoglycoside phosphotransferase (APT) family kinase protein